MKSTRYMAFIAAAMFLLLVVGAWPAAATITGSPHDLSDGSSGRTVTGEDQICRACHVPHSARQAEALWSRDLGTGPYTPYGPGMDLEFTPGAPTGISLLCLGCHDATINIGEYEGSPDPTEGPVLGDHILTTDLSDDHPVSFDFITAAAADPEINDESTVFGGRTVLDFLEDGTDMQCSTCHDVHNATAEVGTNPTLLREDSAGSAICLACHAK